MITKLQEEVKNLEQIKLLSLHIHQIELDILRIVPNHRGFMRGYILDEEMEKKLGKSAKLKNSVIENEFILNQN